MQKMDFRLCCRDHAGNGLWLCFLVPLALGVSAAQYWNLATETYKLSTVLSAGLLQSSLIIFFKNNNVYLVLASIVQYTLCFRYCLQQAGLVAVFSGLCCTILYTKTFFGLLRKLPKSFTLGEAAIVAQSLVLVGYCAAINLVFSVDKRPESGGFIAGSIIQTTLLTLTGLSSSKFFFLKLFGLTAILHTILYFLVGTIPFLWILQLLFYDKTTIILLVYWLFCVVVAAALVHFQVSGQIHATTASRKTFHLLMVAVYLPGIWFKCNLLYLASGLMLCLFLLLETLRVHNIPFFAPTLQQSVAIYKDHKDTDLLSLTPICLLAGCSLPLWLHPAPWDVTESGFLNFLPLISGILSIGIGDSFASIVGMKLGKHKWPGSLRSYEGTLACIVSQVLVIALIWTLGLIKFNVISLIWLGTAIVITSFVEAKTEQIDNLVLPLIMYILLV